MKPRTRRYLWLFAALLPVVLFVRIKERQSWKPRFIALPAHEISQSQYLWLAWFHDGRRLACVNANKIFIMDTTTGQIEKTLKTDSKHDWGEPQITADDQILFVGSVYPCEASPFECGDKAIGEIRVFNVATGKLLRSMPGSRNFQIEGDKLHTILVSPKYLHLDNKRVALPFETRTYNWKSGKLLATAKLSIPSSLQDAEFASGVLSDAIWSRDGEYLAAGFYGMHYGGDTKVDIGYRAVGTQVFHVKSGRWEKRLSDAKSEFVVMAREKRVFASTYYAESGSHLQEWSADHMELLHDSNWPVEVQLCGLSASGEYAVGRSGDKAKFIMCKTGRELREINVGDDSIPLRMAFATTGKDLAIPNRNGTLTLWRVN